MATGTFATAINCMDGRTQEPVAQWLRAMFDVDYVDEITEPGPDRILAEGPDTLIQSIRNRVLISVERHDSRVVAVVSHHDCAGNPVSEDQHIQHVSAAVQTILDWKLPVRVIGLWLNDQWQVRVVTDSGADSEAP